jgi:single-stranded-DNA-specific exonuclease
VKYRLKEGSLNNINNPKETILLNREIKDYKKYLNLDDSVLYHYSLLENMSEAVQCLLKHIENGSNIHIVVDPDVDGYTSATLIYKYLKLLSSELNITYSLHTGKQHGISDDIEIPDNINLLIIPDASTNDITQCKKLHEQGIEIIILDHHIANDDLQSVGNGMIVNYNPFAIIVNNQMCDYPNKALSGVGIVYKFLQALDEETWSEYADNFLDLVALGNIADVMDIREFETRRLINKGLSNIKNKFFKALIEKQSYSMENTITVIGIQFYIVPLINALIRTGDADEKELMFKAFLEQDEYFKYKPRRKSKDDPESEEIDESIYDRIARLCANAKGRQNKYKDKSLEQISEYIESKGINNNKIIVANVTDILTENLTGVVAIKVAEKYNKPCLLLRRVKDDEDLYGGSGRNNKNSPIKNLKSFLDETKLFEFVSGHEGAFGINVKRENINKLVFKVNELLKDVDFSFYYDVDFKVDIDDLNISFIRELDSLKYIYGQGISEPLIAILNMEISKKDIKIQGKNNDSYKFFYNDEIAFIKFKAQEDDQILNFLNDDLYNEDSIIVLDIVGKASINSFGSILTPQVIIEEYNIINKI